MSTPEPESSGLPLRALAMVLLSAGIVFAGIGWLTYGGDDPDPAPGQSGSAEVVVAERTPQAPDASAAPQAPGDDEPADTTSEAAPAAGVDRSAVSVRVYNNSTIDGLAGRVSEGIAADGWPIGEVANYEDGIIPVSTVYYGDTPGEREAAEELAAEMGVRVEKRFDGIADAPPGVIVIITSDMDR